RVETVMDKIGMAEVLDSVPGDLTRLQRQTVALARAVVRKPKVLIMDEPVVNLVPEQQAETLSLIKDLQQEFELTTIYATSDLEAAKFLGDRIALLDRGRLIGVEKPELAEALVASVPDSDSRAVSETPTPEIHTVRHADRRALAELPWHLPLAEWPETLLGGLPRGISRHVVRYVEIGDEVLAIKETDDRQALREFDILGALGNLDVPLVEPRAFVSGRRSATGEKLSG